MLTYLMSRVLQFVPVLLTIVILNFLLIRLAPGDPIAYLVGDAPVSPQLYAQLRSRLGLDKPLGEQLFVYLGGLARGDLGYSFVSRAPVASVIGSRLPATLLLMGVQFVLAIACGLVLGVVSATRAGSPVDVAITLLSVVGYAMPVFWLGQMLILLFSFNLNLFPVGGMTSVREELAGLSLARDLLRHLVLPVVTLALFNLAVIARMTRASMREVLGQEYVLYARAKGLLNRSVLYRHALRNALLPVITIVGLNLRTLVGGAVLTETVFAWPGAGRLTFDAIYQRDYPVLMGVFVVAGIGVMLATLLTDIATAYVDPRIRFGSTAGAG